MSRRRWAERGKGWVIRAACGFPAEEFADHVCKSVRAGHVQSEEQLVEELEGMPDRAPGNERDPSTWTA